MALTSYLAPDLRTRFKVGAAVGKVGQFLDEFIYNERRARWRWLSPWRGRKNAVFFAKAERVQRRDVAVGKSSTGYRLYAMRDSPGLGGAG